MDKSHLLEPPDKSSQRLQISRLNTDKNIIIAPFFFVGYESAEYWLCGPKFTTADISATTLVLRLYLLGLDERFFNEKRPLVCDYRRRLLERPGARKLRTMAGYVANQIGNITTNRCLVKAVTCAGALAACIGVGILLYKKL